MNKDFKPILALELPDEYKIPLNTLLSAVEHQDLTPELLNISEEVLTLNPSNHIIWNLRKTLIQKFNHSFDEERIFLDQLFDDEIKNYQLWNHRRWLVTTSNDDSKEKEFIEKILSADLKNIHCWTYRMFCVKHFNWDHTEELRFAELCLEDDIRNNSAWSYRSNFVEKDEKEVSYVIQAINTDSENESAWNWLAFLLENNKKFLEIEEVKEFIEKFVDPKSDVFSVFGAVLFFSLKNQGIHLNYDSSEIVEKSSRMDPKRRSFYEFLAQN